MILNKMCYANKKILKLKIKRYLSSRVFNHIILEYCLDAKCACNCLEMVEITRKEEKYIWKFVIDWRQFIIWRIQMVLLWSFLLTDHLLFLFFSFFHSISFARLKHKIPQCQNWLNKSWLSSHQSIKVMLEI